MKRFIKLYWDEKYQFNQTAQSENNDFTCYDDNDDLVAVSESVEVDFPEPEKEEILVRKIAVIEKQIKLVQADAEASITALKGRKQELLSIGHDNG